MKKLIIILALGLGLTANGQCEFTDNSVDEFTGVKSKILKDEKWIVNKGKNMIFKLYGADISGYKLLYIFVTVKSSSAYSTYGALDKGAEIMLKSDSSMVTLKLSKSDYGEANYSYNYTTYSTYIILTEDEVIELKGKSFNKARIYWSKGYDDYEINMPNLINDHLECLE